MSNLISVTQFNKYVHDIFLAEEILQSIEIFGEVSGMKVSNANAYFNIKDDDALLACVKFGITSLDYVPKDGEMVIVRGSPNYYIKGGRFSFNVSKISPYGQGLLYQQFIELKNRLEKQGYFDTAHKKPLPQVIKRVGVVSSDTGAVIHDIIDITRRRNRMLDIVLYPAKVQGIGAEDTIVAGIRALDATDVDVIIVARGGGSLEDLSPFNTEKVATAIYEANKPVISAVGHETDFTIADFVADVRAPTPSAGAELVSNDISSISAQLTSNVQRLQRLTNDWMTNAFNLVDDAFSNMQNLVSDNVLKQAQKVQSCASKFSRLSLSRFNDVNSNFDKLTARLEARNPVQILRNGYAQVVSNHKAVTDANDVNVGDDVDIYLHKGMLHCEIKSKTEN